jgi:hypothetical protein
VSFWPQANRDLDAAGAKTALSVAARISELTRACREQAVVPHDGQAGARFLTRLSSDPAAEIADE